MNLSACEKIIFDMVIQTPCLYSFNVIHLIIWILWSLSTGQSVRQGSGPTVN